MVYSFKVISSTSLFLILISCVNIAATQNVCPETVCSHNEPVIRYPFRIRNRQSKSCGYPGFEISCGSYNETILELPFSGKFVVQAIDYDRQEIWINDQENCLADRILSLNLSGSPFHGLNQQFFMLFNCSPFDYSKYGLNPIACLSGYTYTVFATSSSRFGFFLQNGISSCNFIRLVYVPVNWPLYQQILSTDFSEDLRLTWEKPRCGKCESGGGRCAGLKTNSSEVVCPDVPHHGNGSDWLPILYTLFLQMVKYCNRSSRRSGGLPESDSTVNTVPVVTVAGLDGATIESYSKIVLGESRRLPKPDDNTCSICLCEYKPQETLKTIPECKHCFHSDCIEEWLRLRATCPLCRNSPERLPPAGS
ncbi:RING/U-BOX SUPERFAMILY PROTEIN [Salix purpurea]|uniref:RING-type E3 ubiquitin transferase n=1 Tax=Salix purpurea TaxID=77065 RepID=A0A9Q0W421_SALPP|nr:RING/U-BOX SUPERFAMILY PROTEIN [Salix purpurea]